MTVKTITVEKKRLLNGKKTRDLLEWLIITGPKNVYLSTLFIVVNNLIWYCSGIKMLNNEKVELLKSRILFCTVLIQGQSFLQVLPISYTEAMSYNIFGNFVQKACSLSSISYIKKLKNTS